MLEALRNALGREQPHHVDRASEPVMTAAQVLDIAGGWDEEVGYTRHHALLLHYACTPRVPLADALLIGVKMRDTPLTPQAAEYVVAHWYEQADD